MPIRIDRAQIRCTLFLLIAVTVNVVDHALVHSMRTSPARLVVSAGACFDLIVLVSAIYYWLLVRSGLRSWTSTCAVALLGVLHAVFLLPTPTAARAALAGMGEAALLTYVAIGVRQRLRYRSVSESSDPLDTISATVSALVGIPFIATVISAEVSVLYYALFSWRAAPHVPAGATPFTLDKSGRADLLSALAAASLVEAPAVHLLMSAWSRNWAWVATAAGLYGGIWLTGLARSIRLRPALVGPDAVELRFGLTFRLRAPRKAIQAVRPCDARGAASAFVLPSRSEPNVLIELVEPVQAEQLLGVRKPVVRLALMADDPQALILALSGEN